MISTLTRRFADTWFSFHPQFSTERGYPKYHDRLISLDEKRVSEFCNELNTLEREIQKLPTSTGDTDDWINQELLGAYCRMGVFPFKDLNCLKTNPLIYVQWGMEAIEALLLRTDLPTRQRDKLIAKRLCQFPRLLLEMMEQVTAPEEPFTTLACEMLGASMAYLEERFSRNTVPEFLSDAATETLPAFDRAHDFLLAQKSVPFKAMGEKAYKKLLFEEHRLECSLEDLIATATKQLTTFKNTAPFVAPNIPKIKIQSWDQVFNYYKQEIKSVQKFIEKKKLVTIPNGKMELVEIPEYLQTIMPGAFYHPPPLLGKKAGAGFFYVKRLPRKLSSDQKNYYSEVLTHRRFRTLVVHEAYPGHHVQFLYARKNPHLVRKIRDNDLLVEGWAFYCEKLLYDEGLWDKIPSPNPARSIGFRALRVLVDIGIHTGQLSLKQAENKMVKFFGEGSRRFMASEVARYATEPSQALSYLIGREELLQLREDWRSFQGDKKFSLLKFHTNVLKSGSIPIAFIRKRMLPENP